MIDFILGYVRYGRKLYPYLFMISLFVFPFNFINVFTHKFNEWNIIALICYTLFFGGILIGYCYDKSWRS